MISDAIASLGVLTYTRRARTGTSIDANGRAVAPSTADTPLIGMMQVLSGREVDRLPEGLHTKDVRYFFTTDTSLVVADSETSKRGDHVLDLDGTEYEVVKRDDWTALGAYMRYTLSKVDL